MTARHAVAVNSATSALHIACLALGLGPGDRLWTVPNTFVASANCARYCGAEVDFVDIDPAHLESERSGAGGEARAWRSRAGALPKVVVPVHFAGQPTEQEAIWELAQRVRLQGARGCVARHRRRRAMVSRSAAAAGRDITVFSFHPVKIITSGEGGMALTNDGAARASACACCAPTASRAMPCAL